MQRWTLVLLAFSGLFGAAGVAAAALSVHEAAGPDLQIASYFLLFHAAAIGGIAGGAVLPRAGFLTSASILAAGTLLFCGDLAMRGLTGTRLLPMAAPTGGSLLILGWLVLTFVSVRGLWSRGKA